MKTKFFICQVVLFYLVCLGSTRSFAQSFSQEVIGSSGSYTASSEGSMSWTLGEIMIQTFFSDANSFTQGFHQPNKRKAAKISLFIPEGFSPNGDQINDLFVIRNIDNYSNNKIVIFNRWGNKVFDASPYENTWDGTCITGVTVGNNNALPVGTYFYILELEGGVFFKGSIYLNR